MMLCAFSAKCPCKHTIYASPEDVVWKMGTDNRAREMKTFGAVCPSCNHFNTIAESELPESVVKNATKSE